MQLPLFKLGAYSAELRLSCTRSGADLRAGSRHASRVGRLGGGDEERVSDTAVGASIAGVLGARLVMGARLGMGAGARGNGISGSRPAGVDAARGADVELEAADRDGATARLEEAPREGSTIRGGGA
uniref:Uncharacterized protein n=1 Tax=Chrysotila carterae TaxID=13221 RepID=A0A7S4C175_CHRCT|mmetsp:Transcript_57998/g.125971  ORF Transcript_57998/g.125971 Transcript_57998/m.125971 type:complete len:127 (-) Transcript_57998:83-463(-)